jgi:hypothetical protein
MASDDRGGLVLGIAHTAGFAALGVVAPAPADPLAGAALLALPRP